MRRRRARLPRRVVSAAAVAAAGSAVLLLLALHWASAPAEPSPAAAAGGVSRAASGPLGATAIRVGWAVLWLVLLLMVFAALAVMCDAHLVPAIEIICKRGHIPDEIAGASLLAFGSSAPEVMINSVAVAAPHPQIDMSLPAIFGSAMIAFGLIPALCAVVVGGELELNAYPIARDSLCYAVSLLMLVFILSKGAVGAAAAGLLVAAFVVYMFILAAPLLWARCSSADESAKGGKLHSRKSSRYLRDSRGSHVSGLLSPVPGASRRLTGSRLGASRSSHPPSARRRSRGSSGYGAIPEVQLAQVEETGDESESAGKKDDDWVQEEEEEESCAARMCGVVMDPFEKVCDAVMFKFWFTVEPERVRVPVPSDHAVRAAGPARALGVALEAGDAGLVVTGVKRGSPAAAAGVKPGWVLERMVDSVDGGDGDDDDGDDDGDDDEALEDEEALQEAWDEATGEHAALFHEPPSNGVVAFVFGMALVWVSILSTLCLEITQMFTDTICMPQTLAGATLLALGAQVPDTMGSVAMARAGLADGAVSNAVGSQLINVSLGIGLPFLLYDLIRGEAISVGASDMSSLIGMGSCLACLIVVYLCCCLWRYVTFRPEWHAVELSAKDFRALEWVSPPPTGPDGETKVARVAPAGDALSTYPPAAAIAGGLDVGVSVAQWRTGPRGVWLPVDPHNPGRCGSGAAAVELKVLRKGGLSWRASGKVLLAAFFVAFVTFVSIDVASSSGGGGEHCGAA